VAQAIHKGMSRLVEQCDIAAINEVDIRHLADYDLIGLGSPVWGGVPPHIQLFINSLPPLQGKHAFAFCTHGALPDKFAPAAVRLLAKIGLTVIAVGNWYGSVNLPSLPKPYLTDGHPDAIDLEEAEHFGREMVDLSRRISAGETKLIPPEPTIQTLIKPPQLLRPKLNIQKCRYPECRLCIDNCPMNAIDLSVSPPVFAKSCRPCYFCEMICPEGAIEVDYESQAKEMLLRVKNVYEKALDKAEAEGRFRRLVPLSNVGWDTPYYMVYNRHPRYVIPAE